MMQKYGPKVATKILYFSIVEENSGKVLHVAKTPCHGSNAAGGGGRRRRRPRGVEVELGMATNEGTVVAEEAELDGGGAWPGRRGGAWPRRACGRAWRRRLAGERRRRVAGHGGRRVAGATSWPGAAASRPP
jgi:hypothetical protein